jgi:hypothetical protein
MQSGLTAVFEQTDDGWFVAVGQWKYELLERIDVLFHTGYLALVDFSKECAETRKTVEPRQFAYVIK